MTRLGWLHSFTIRRAVPPFAEIIDISLPLWVTITMNQSRILNISRTAMCMRRDVMNLALIPRYLTTVSFHSTPLADFHISKKYGLALQIGKGPNGV